MTEVVKLISTYVKIESVLMNLKFQAVDFIHFFRRNLTFGNSSHLYQSRLVRETCDVIVKLEKTVRKSQSD